LRPRGRIIPPLFVAFVLGAAAGWLIHARMSPPGSGESPLAAPDPTVRDAERPSAAPVPDTEIPRVGIDPIAALRKHRLRLPLDNMTIEAMKGSFAEGRNGGARRHEAVDILAPRLTPVRAVGGGTIARLFFSKAGGTTIYQFDPSGEFCYYYAHLDRYAPGLREGQTVLAGEVIGYVGTSGNAPESTPHLHFAIFQLTDARRWWQGTPIDPYLVYGP
jgi:murein DD-endopeptidase MepM/ murein hydrolase activator NlpD